jgi:hypothetical protein
MCVRFFPLTSGPSSPQRAISTIAEVELKKKPPGKAKAGGSDVVPRFTG